MNRRLKRWFLWILVFGAALLGLSIFSLCVGSAGLSLKKIVASILAGKGSAEYSILFDIRLPRIILGVAVGGALSLAGVILQAMFRNPLVEPYTLGVSGGAALGVCLNIVFGLSARLGLLTLPLFGFFGAALAIVLAYALSIRKGVFKMPGLLLTGVMLSFISSSLIMLIMALTRTEELHGIIFWTMGSLGECSWLLIKLVFWTAIFLLAAAYLFCHHLNALALGEEEALHLGINVEQTKRLLFILASLLTGTSVSVAGIIGFVGLLVPHFVRMFVGRDHRILLISAFLCGAGFLVFCDTLARTIVAPLELPVGVITGILGGSIFIYTLSKRQPAL